MVAVSTLLFTGIGIFIGYHFLNKNFQIIPMEIINETNYFFKTLWIKSKIITKDLKNI
jgi:hypothetical protein